MIIQLYNHNFNKYCCTLKHYTNHQMLGYASNQLHMHVVWELFKDGVYFVQLKQIVSAGTIKGQGELKEYRKP